VQVAGRERGNRAALDLADFERQQIKLKATISF
jgi:hypothetical protein